MLRLSKAPVALLVGEPSTVLIAAWRWLSRPVRADASTSTAVTLPAPSVTLPAASLARFSRWMAPRAVISVVATSTPSWRTAWPVIVMSPTGALIRPVLRTWPALLSVLSVALISTPVVVDLGLPSVP
ncbi:hypothetical protein D3C72_1194000 [compost metagenome]